MSLRSTLWPAYRRFLQSTDWPILVGPWLGEVGFEALYWLPWLRASGLDKSRLIPITRGGAGTWYGTERHVELFALREPRLVRIETAVRAQRTGLQKQMAMTPFDRAVIREAAAQLGLTRYHVLHPAWMYHDLQPFWNGARGLSWLWPRITAPDPKQPKTRIMQSPSVAPLPPDVVLPKEFVAARFYLRSTFPHAQSTVTLVKSCLQTIAKRLPVVLLNSGVHADEHMDLAISGPNVIALSDLVPLTVENNLAMQAAVIEKAQGFVGTYGGIAQLALRHRKPTVSFYADWQGTAIAHKHLSDAIAVQSGVPFLCVRLAEIPLMHATIPPMQFET